MTTQERGRQRHAHLLNAAVDLLTEGGFPALTHRAVAHRAGLPLAATTYYFTSRAHLLAEAFTQLVDTELATFRHWTTHPDLADHLTHQITTTDRNRQLGLWELYVHAGRDPALQHIARRWTDGCVHTLADALHLPATDPRPRHLYTTLATLWLEHLVEQRPAHDLRTQLTIALKNASHPTPPAPYTAPVLKPHYPITTDRLLLRPFTPHDLHPLHAYESRPDVTRHLYWGPRDLDTTRAFLDKKISRTALLQEGDALDLAITLPGTGDLIGNCLLIWTSQEHRQGEIGYILNPSHHGHGYAPEAAREMLRLGFDHLGLHRIIGRLDARNTASARVLEKLGMRREAHLIDNERVKGEWSSEMIYAMLATEWTP